jgi:serine/threonine-protein kinase
LQTSSIHDPDGRATAPAPHGEWARLMSLFDTANELGQDERMTMLERMAREGDPLLPQLRALLRASDRASATGFLSEFPCLEGTPPDPVDGRAGQVIGPYRLDRLLGTGGMADVWLAERVDGAFHRKVALKLQRVRATPEQRDSFVGRFEREKNIVAGLDHPNIATLHDAGVTSDGQPWMALEYIDGEPITSWCELHDTSVRQRVAVFVQVLRAVAYAHAHLVLHRDLKPANILVREGGSPALLDFGIAKLLSPVQDVLIDTELTRDGGHPLTIAYASPEQILGEPLTIACDIYSLGVVLYELTCGARPFDEKASALALQSAIARDDPVPPSRRAAQASMAAAMSRSATPPSWRQQLAGDLDAIVMKSLRKEPRQRYLSTSAFADDLERWLEGRPVAARPPTRLYLATKFIARHRWGVGATALGSVALLTTAIVAVVSSVRANEQTRRVTVSRDALMEIFRQADPDQGHGSDVTAREMLAQSRRRIERVFATQPDMQAEFLAEIGDLQGSVGDDVAAAQTLAKVMQLYGDGRHPREQLKARIAYASELYHLGDLGRAQTEIDAAWAASAPFGRDADLRVDLTVVKGQVAWMHHDYSVAGRLLETAVEASTALHGPTDARTLDALGSLVSIEEARGDFSSARRDVDELVRRTKSIHTVAPTELQRLEFLRARILMADGRYRQAKGALDAAIPNCWSALGMRNEWCLLLSMRQAELLIREGRASEAMNLAPGLEEGASLQTAPRRQAESLVTVCRILAANGKLATDSPYWHRLQVLGRSGSELPLSGDLKAKALLAEAEAMVIAHRPSEALSVLQLIAERIARDASLAASTAVTARHELLQGLALRQQGDVDGAESALRRALATAQRGFGADDVLAQVIALDLAGGLRAPDERDERARIAQRAQQILAERFGADSPVVRAAMSLQMAPPNGRSPAEAPEFFLI